MLLGWRLGLGLSSFLELLFAPPVFQGSHFLFLVHITRVKSELRSYSSILREGCSEAQKGKIRNKTQKSRVKNQNDKSKRKDVVRGFSLLPGRDSTTPKGRTTVVLGILAMGLPRFARNHKGGEGLGAYLLAGRRWTPPLRLALLVQASPPQHQQTCASDNGCKQADPGQQHAHLVYGIGLPTHRELSVVV